MRIKIRLFLLFALFAVISCTDDSKSERFVDEVASNAAEFISTDSLFDPGLLTVCGDYLVVCNYKNEPLIEVYHIPTKKVINKFLKIGDGPNEVIMIGNIQYNSSKDELLVADPYKKKIFSYAFKDVISQNDPQPTVLYKRAEESELMFTKLFVIRDFFVAESRDPRGRILLLNKEGKEKGYYLDYPGKDKIDQKLNDIQNAGLYSSSVTINPSLDKIALATNRAGMIDVCEIKSNEVKPKWSYAEFYPIGMVAVPMGNETVVAWTNSAKNGFFSIDSSDKYIYALYSGKLNDDPNFAYGDVVYVASWNGKKTYKIKLDKLVNRLTVDADDKWIYGITRDMDIVVFPIPKR